MNQRITPRLWATFGVSIIALIGLALLLVFLSRGPGAPTPITTAVVPTPTDDPTVASVNGHPIRRSIWVEAALLDQVMSGIAAQPAPASDETLQRLINEHLLLTAFPPAQEPTREQIEEEIAQLEESWGVTDAAVVIALQNVGLGRPAFEQAVGRLLMVQAALELVEGQGHDITAWLEEQRAAADIVLDEELEDMVAQYSPVGQSQSQSQFQSPLATVAGSPLPTPAPVTVLAAQDSPLASPTPDSAIPERAIPEVAPDFTLSRAGGGQLTLSEQVAQGPVVLVFFQKCG